MVSIHPAGPARRRAPAPPALVATLLALAPVAVAGCDADRDAPLQPAAAPLAIVGPDTIHGVTSTAVYQVDLTGTLALQAQWSSSAPAVLASSEPAGTFVSQAAGTAVVRVTAGSRSAEKAVVVHVAPPPPPQQLLLTAEPDTLLTSLNDTVHIAAVLRWQAGDEIAALEVQWSSSDTAVAEVDDGAVVGRASGRSVITARASGLEASIAVTVALAEAPPAPEPPEPPPPAPPEPPEPPPPGEPDPPVLLLLTAQPDTLLTSLGDTVWITAAVQLASGGTVTPASVQWASSDTAVAVVAAGRVLPRADGRTVITARAEGLEASLPIRVALPGSPPPPSTVTVTLAADGDTLMTAVNDTLAVTVLVQIGSDPPFAPSVVEWQSSDPSVATVEAGRVVARANGGARITARTHDAEASLDVAIAQVATDLTLGAAAYAIAAPGSSVQLVATARDRRGNPVSGVTKTWTTSHPQRIWVDAAGVATALTYGSATISVAAVGVTRSAAVRVVGGTAPVLEQVRAGITRFASEASVSYVLVTLELRDPERDMDSLTITLLDANGGTVARHQERIEQGVERVPFSLHAASAGSATQVLIDAFDAAGNHAAETVPLRVSPTAGSPRIDHVGFERVGGDSVHVEIEVSDQEADVEVLWLVGFDADGGWTFLEGFQIEPTTLLEWYTEIGVRGQAVAATDRFGVVVVDAAGNLSLVHRSPIPGAAGGMGALQPPAADAPSGVARGAAPPLRVRPPLR